MIPQPVVGWLNDLGVKYAEHQLSWNFVEPEQGIFNWPLLDNGIDAMNSAGIKVVSILCMPLAGRRTRRGNCATLLTSNSS